MTAWHSGRVVQLADQGLAGLDGVAVLVLATLWSFARRDPPHYCSASVPRIARRAHLSPRAVGYALHRLRTAGWVDWKDDPKPGVTIERILAPLPTPARDAGVDGAGTPAPDAQTPAPDAQTPARDAGTPAPDAANSQESSLRKRSDDDSDQDGRDGADAPRSALEDEVAEGMGVGVAAARAQIDGWLAAASSPPRSVAAYVRKCLLNEIAAGRRAEDAEGAGADEPGGEDLRPPREPCDRASIRGAAPCPGGPAEYLRETGPGRGRFNALCEPCFQAFLGGPDIWGEEWLRLADGAVETGEDFARERETRKGRSR